MVPALEQEGGTTIVLALDFAQSAAVSQGLFSPNLQNLWQQWFSACSWK